MLSEREGIVSFLSDRRDRIGWRSYAIPSEREGWEAFLPSFQTGRERNRSFAVPFGPDGKGSFYFLLNLKLKELIVSFPSHQIPLLFRLKEQGLAMLGKENEFFY